MKSVQIKKVFNDLKLDQSDFKIANLRINKLEKLFNEEYLNLKKNYQKELIKLTNKQIKFNQDFRSLMNFDSIFKIAFGEQISDAQILQQVKILAKKANSYDMLIAKCAKSLQFEFCVNDKDLINKIKEVMRDYLNKEDENQALKDEKIDLVADKKHTVIDSKEVLTRVASVIDREIEELDQKEEKITKEVEQIKIANLKSEENIEAKTT